MTHNFLSNKTIPDLRLKLRFLNMRIREIKEEAEWVKGEIKRREEIKRRDMENV